jgi:hypothetical protein
MRSSCATHAPQGDRTAAVDAGLDANARVLRLDGVACSAADYQPRSRPGRARRGSRLTAAHERKPLYVARYIMPLATSRSEYLYCAVLDGHTIERAEWDLWLSELEAGTLRRMRVIVESNGGGPSAAQRREFVNRIQCTDPRIVVLTDSSLARGIITAVAWLGVPLRGFRLNELTEAALYLELSNSELAKARHELARLKLVCRSASRRAAANT